MEPALKEQIQDDVRINQPTCHANGQRLVLLVRAEGTRRTEQYVLKRHEMQLRNSHVARTNFQGYGNASHFWTGSKFSQQLNDRTSIKIQI